MLSERKKAKRPGYPTASEAQYVALLRSVIAVVTKDILKEFDKISPSLKPHLRQDVDSMISVSPLVSDLNLTLEKKAPRFIASAKKLATENKNIISESLGIDIVTRDISIEQQINAWVADSAGLIKGLTKDSVDDINGLINQAVINGDLYSTLRDDIIDKLAMTERRAELIARTEISTLNAKITENRHKELGISEFVWRTSKDARVRDSHRELEGKRFSYDVPPDIPKEGIHLPGCFPNCRCRAEPVPPKWLEL
jgi:SPP1 gp7 family putative phage head morphogenesis protein